MSKRKTVLKFAIAAVLLGGSSTVAVLYFPYVALAIKFGVVVSAAPIVIFAISAMVALASVIALTALVVSALRSKGKSNEVVKELRSKNQDEERSLVQEEEQAVPIPTLPLFPQEPEELVTPAQQQPVGDSAEATEMPQHEEDTNFVVEKVASTEQTGESLSSLPPYPEPTSPMNSLESLPFPNPPSGEHHSLRNARNLLPHPSQQTRVKVLYNGTEDSLPSSPPIEPLNSFDQSQPFPSLPSIVIDGRNSSGNSSRSVRNHGPQNERRVFYRDEEASLSSSISSLYGSHYSTSSDLSSSLGSLNSSSSSRVSSDCSNSSNDDFDSDSYLSSTMTNSMPPLNNVHDIMHYRQNHPGESDLSLSIPGSMIAGEVVKPYLQGHRINQVVQYQQSRKYEVDERIFDSMDGQSPNYVKLWLRTRNKDEPVPDMYCASTSTEHQVAPSCLPDYALQGIGADPNTINHFAPSAQNYESFNYPALVHIYNTSPRSAWKAKSLPLNDSGPEGMLSGVHPVKYNDFKSI